jgi:hypothetical protein
MTVNDSQILRLGYLQSSRYNGSLRDIRSGDLILVGARFSIPVQTDTVPHPASCTMSTDSIFSVIKQSGHGVDHPPSSTAEVKERVELYLLSPSGPSWSVLG